MKITDWINEHKSIVIILFGISIIILIVALVLVFKPKELVKQSNSVTVVSFNDGNNEVIVDRSGQVTIKTPFGTFTQFWDKEKIKRFFEDIDNLDFDSLVAYIGTDLAISLTSSNGRQIIVDTTQLPSEILDLLQITLEDTYQQEQITVVKSTPPVFATPKPPVTYETTATPIVSNTNPWHQGTEPENIQPFSCEAYSVTGSRRVIVSNTLCGQ